MRRRRKKRSHLEESFLRLVNYYGLPVPKEEVWFQDRWRFDFCYPQAKIFIEIDGGTYTRGGGHATGERYARDCEKRNAAQLDGWMVLAADKDMACDHKFAKLVKTALNKRLAKRNLHVGFLKNT